MQTLKFIGRGSAFNVKEGNTSAYIKDKDTLLLIDCGESVFKEIQEKKLLDDINNIIILITHLHSDHVGSLSSLIFYCYYIKKIIPIIYFEDYRNIVNLLLLQGNIEGKHYDIIRREVINDSIKIESVHSSHVSLYKDTYRGKVYEDYIRSCRDESIFDSYGYYIYYNDKKIYYSGDNNLIQYHDELRDIEGIDEWYQDTCLVDYKNNVHLSLRELCEDIDKEYRHKVYCMHIDCDELIVKAKENGFNVVEVEGL